MFYFNRLSPALNNLTNKLSAPIVRCAETNPVNKFNIGDLK